MAPTVTSVQRTSATSARVDWDPVPHQNKNGDLVNYNLGYSTATTNGTCVASFADQYTSLASASDYVGFLTALDPLQEYCVRVAGATVHGVGVFGRYWKIPCKLYHESDMLLHKIQSFSMMCM